MSTNAGNRGRSAVLRLNLLARQNRALMRLVPLQPLPANPCVAGSTPATGRRFSTPAAVPTMCPHECGGTCRLVSRAVVPATLVTHEQPLLFVELRVGPNAGPTPIIRRQLFGRPWTS